MEYRKIGDSALELSVITFGAWAAGGWMWGGTERKDAVNAIRASYDLGVTSIDTAPVYGQGLSEDIVGEAISGIPRDKVQLLTKYGMRWNGEKGDFAFKTNDNNGKEIEVYKYARKESIIAECEDSLRFLKTDYIDLYQIHWPDKTTPISESMEAVAKLIEDGKVRFAGVSNYSKEQMEEAEKTLRIVSNQVPYSMVKRDIEQELIPYCIEKHKGILAYSPLQRGLLTGKITPDYPFKEGDSRKNLYFFSAENIGKADLLLEKLKPLAEEKGVSLSQLVLRWTIDQPGITIALVGARDARQAVQNAEAINVKITQEENDFIRTEVDKVNIVKP